MNYRRNIVTGGLLFAFALAYFLMAFGIPVFKGLGSTPVDARFTPQLWGGLLMLLSALLVLRGVRERAALIKAGKLEGMRAGTARAWFAANSSVVWTFVALFVYIALLGTVGFIIMSILYIVAQTLILTPPGKRNLPLTCLIAVVASVGVDYIFVRLLFVMLPAGVLGF